MLNALSRRPCYTKNCRYCERVEGKNVQHSKEKLSSAEKVSVCPFFDNKEIIMTSVNTLIKEESIFIKYC